MAKPESAIQSRNLLKLLGIDINSSANGVYLPPAKTGDSTTKTIDGQYLLSTPNISHEMLYYDFVWQKFIFVEKIEDRKKAKAAALVVLNEIRKLLLTGQLEIWVEKN